MFILSIDASTHSTGYAIYENSDLKDYGCITASSNDLIKRIQKIIFGQAEVLQKYPIDKIILEEVRIEVGINVKTYKALMYQQAAIEFLIHERFPKIEIIYLYPSQWRSLCGIKTGRGRRREELKKNDIEFVKNQFNISKDINDDIADAIGIGFGYLKDQNYNEGFFWD